MNVVANMQAEKNRQIMHSIDYASVIQRSLLRPPTWPCPMRWPTPTSNGSRATWWAATSTTSPNEDGWFAAIADCTGHGVPGAFMTLISSST
jgi:hypothetical protein